MNTLVRWHTRPRFNPLAVACETPSDDLIAGFFRPATTAAKEILLDVSENDKAYRVSAALPGVKKEDIRLAVDKNEVTIAVEFKHDTTVAENERTLHRERFHGKTSRTFLVNDAIDADSVEARYADGVLQLTLPKKVAASARHITIN